MATISDPTESITDLKSLYNVEATFEYTSRASLVRALRTFPRNRDTIQDHTVLITRFPPRMFDIDDNNNLGLPHKGKPLYFRDRKILIFTMTERPHEILARALCIRFYEKLKKMNCEEDLVASGGAKESLQNLNKAPDESWGPIDVSYATLVAEVGSSESLRALDADAQRWIQNKRSHVTQVITVKIYPHRPEIIFAVWGCTNRHKPEKKYEVHVERHQGRPRVIGNNKSLHLSLEKILERPPASGTSGREIILTARDLCGLALPVWRDMDIKQRGYLGMLMEWLVDFRSSHKYNYVTAVREFNIVFGHYVYRDTYKIGRTHADERMLTELSLILKLIIRNLLLIMT